MKATMSMSTFDQILGLRSSDSMYYTRLVHTLRTGIKVRHVYEDIPGEPHPTRDAGVCRLINVLRSLAGGTIQPIVDYSDMCRHSGRSIERALSSMNSTTSYICRNEPVHGTGTLQMNCRDIGILSASRGTFVPSGPDVHSRQLPEGCRVVYHLREYQTLVGIHGHRNVDIFRRGVKFDVDGSTVSVGHLVFFGWCWTVDFIGFLESVSGPQGRVRVDTYADQNL